MESYADVMFHGAVADLQRADGTYNKYQTAYKHRTSADLGSDDVDFIRRRDSFYLASITEDGWPYVQHRGGRRGFVHVIGPAQLACADYRGNRQFISMGNLQNEPRVSLFFMDYLNHARLKIQGKATLRLVSEVDTDLVARLDNPEAPAERILVVDVVAIDWNCPKYIPTLYPEDALQEIVGPQIAKLQAENEALKSELAKLRGP